MREQEEIARTNLRVTMAAAFENGEIFNESEEILQKYLSYLCTERVPNEEVRHREIIRALTINHIQMQRHIDKLNKRNTVLQWLVIFLAVLAFIATGYQIYRQKPKLTAPIRQETLNSPSISLETKGSISKTSKETLSYIHPQTTTTSIRKKEKPLSINSEPKAYQPPIKDETKQKHK